MDCPKELINQGFDWYYERFLAPKRHRMFLAIIFLILLLFAWLILKLTLIDISVTRIPFPIYYADEIRTYPVIDKLRGDYRDINKVISSYLLRQYVEKRESYSRRGFEETNWKPLQKQLMGFSSREVYAEYLKNMSTSNPDSPYFNYLRNRVREVKVDRVEVNKNNTSANVYFTTIDTDKDLREVIEHMAVVEYFITDAELVKMGKRDFQFLITDYRVD